MNKLNKLLPALALVLGAMMAMAMNFADDPTVRYAEDPAPGPEIWYNLQGVTPGTETYLCNTNNEVICSYESPDKDSDPVEPGVFVIKGELDPMVK